MSRPLSLGLALVVLLPCSPLSSAWAQGVPFPAPARTATVPTRAERDATSLADATDAAGRLLAARAVPLAIGRSPSGEVRANVFIRAARGTERSLRARGVRVGTRAGEWLTAEIALDALAEVARVPGVTAVRIAWRARLTSDSSAVDIGVTGVRSRPYRDLFEGATGRGAIIGFVDSGVDFRHPDFLEDDTGRSRILYLWDQTATGSGPGAIGDATFTYGAECARDQLGATGRCEARDYVGHGTHVAGTAAGDGSGAHRGPSDYGFAGVAPGAELIVVKTDLFTNQIVDGVDYIFRRAAELGRPAVVNLSIGAPFGPHDGSDILSVAIDALTGPGRIVVASAGNDGNNETGGPAQLHPRLHGEGRALAVGDSVRLAFTVGAYSPRPGAGNDLVFAQLYYQPSDTFSATLVRPNGDTVGIPFAGTRSDLASSGGVLAYHGPIAGDSILGDDFAQGRFSPTAEWNTVSLFLGEWFTSAGRPGPGSWQLILVKQSRAGTGQVDAYLPLSTLTSVVQFTAGATNRGLVGPPGDGHRVITVGAYTTRHAWESVDGNTYEFEGDQTPVGGLMSFSSPGPTLDGRAKPEISAPGRVFGTLSSSAVFPFQLVAPDSSHLLLEGTSMSAPHVAGAVALLLAERPTLTPEEALAALTSAARQDAFTAVSHAGDSGIPNASWGYGKLGVPGALASVSPLAGRAFAAAKPSDAHVRSSVRGTILPLQSLRIAAADAESLEVRTIGATVDGRDAGIRLALAVDENHDGEVGEGEPLLALTESMSLDGPRYVVLTLPAGDVLVPRGGAVDLILAGQLSGATPNATTFTGQVIADSSATIGLRTGTALTFGGSSVARASLRTTVLAAGERANVSQNPVRSAPLTINFVETARRIDVYDFAGRRVRTIVPDAADRFARWDLRTDAGAEVVPGTYLLLLDLASGLVRQKLFITR